MAHKRSPLSSQRVSIHEKKEVKNRKRKEKRKVVTSNCITIKIIYGVTIYDVTFKIMTPYDLKFTKMTHHIKIFN